MRQIKWLLCVGSLAAAPALAQDPVKVDPAHYKVEFENTQVRVLRIKYGPHEKSVMDWHPASVAVFLTDLHVKFGLPDGKARSKQGPRGKVCQSQAARTCRKI